METHAIPAAAADRKPRRRATPDDALTPRSRVGSWHVEQEIGRGGMASVHAVVRTKFGKRAAIKIAHRSIIGPQLTAKTFLREARIVHAVEHPGVVDVFATGSFQDRPYLVMERLVGKTLGQRVDEGPVPRAEALEVLLELCDVLRVAHAAGVIHRDLKLDNVFLLDAPTGAGRRVKLLDWGVAHVAGEDDPFVGMIAGTLQYVAPEQIRDDALTGAADIYSLAVVAYHVLCCRPPFASNSELALIQMHLRKEPPRPSIAWPGIPTILEDLLIAMLDKDPTARPPLDEIERVLRLSLAAIAPAHDAPREADPPSALVDWVGRRDHRATVAFGPPALPVPPWRASWISLALGVVALAGLLSVLP